MDSRFEELFSYISGLEIIDTHEHLPHCEAAREQDTDVLKEYLTHYFNRDLLSAGLSWKEHRKAIDSTLPLMERWNLVEPYWEASRYTGYCQSLDITARGLYGIDKISRTTIQDLNEAFQKTIKPGHYQRVLRDKSNIKIGLLDANLGCDREFFRSVYRLDSFIRPDTFGDIFVIENELGIRICRFDDWLDACEAMLDRALEQGAVALKCAIAYERSLSFQRVTKAKAEEQFNQLLHVNHYPDWVHKSLAPGKDFQDYMMHHILHLANKRHLTYQFHTGLQEGCGNLISNSDPALLSNLFLEYPDVDFCLLHIGYPYQHVLPALAKTFPNVYLDMAWAHIISPTASIRALADWLDVVPYTKIIAFGGDYCFIDGIYGGQYLARKNVAKALAVKIEEGLFDVEQAKVIARALFYDNPYRIYKLDGKI